MAGVSENSNFDNEVYQIEVTDPLEGGALGILNRAIKNLTNRTRWLFDKVSEIINFLPVNIGSINNFDIGGSTGALNKTGDVESVTIAPDGNYSVLNVTLKKSMGGGQYGVFLQVYSNGNAKDNDSEIRTPVVRLVNHLNFLIYFRESEGHVQDLTIHFRAYKAYL